MAVNVKTLPLWTGTIELVAMDRGDEKALSVTTEKFDPVALVEVLKHMKNQRMADAIVYGLIGQLEEFKIELLALWSDWQVERDEDVPR